MYIKKDQFIIIDKKTSMKTAKVHVSEHQKGLRFDPQQGRFRVALQPILSGGDLYLVNCDANIVSYYYGRAVW